MSTKFLKRATLTLALLLLPLAAHSQSITWPNEPSGAIGISDCAMSGSVCNWGKDFSTQVDAFISDSNPLGSPSTVLDSYLPIGSTVGRGSWSMSAGGIRAVYMGVWVKQNAEFVGNQGPANKFWFARNPAIDNSFINWDGQAHQWRWYQQGQYRNDHIPGVFGMTYCGTNCGDGTGWFYPNQASNGVMHPGTGWHRLEVCIVSSTTTSSKDGVLKWWLDGTAVGSYTNVNIAPLGITEFNINHTWDGFNTANRDTSKAWHWYIDHMRISRPVSGCTAGGGGGGGNPLDNPTGAPSTPSGLTVAPQ